MVKGSSDVRNASAQNREVPSVLHILLLCNVHFYEQLHLSTLSKEYKQRSKRLP